MALKLLEQNLDPNLSASNGTAVPSTNASNHSLRASVIVNSKIPATNTRSSGFYPTLSQLPLPEFFLPRSVCADLPSNLRYFRSVLPQPNDEVQSYPTSRGNPRRETILKVTNKEESAKQS